VIYLDTSAAVKALIPEAGSDAMRAMFASDDELVSSRLLELELATVVQRRNVPESERRKILSRVSLVTLDDVVFDAAIAGASGLRALDALHLATATRLGDIVDSMLSFDRELLEGARAKGIPPHPLVGSAPVG
jgi:predicted nucleic acid-binding protein